MFIALVMLSSHLILWCPPLLCPQFFPASGTFPMSQLFTSYDQNTRATALESVLPANIQGWSPWRLAGLISFCPRDFQKSSPALQLEDINSLVFCLLYGPALPTTCDHWEDHSLDYMDLCWQSNVFAFQHSVYVCYKFPAKKQSSSDFSHHPQWFWSPRRGNLSLLSLSICQAVMGPDAMILVFFNI